jgi:hypothetical protein
MKGSNMVSSLDEFLDDDELNRWLKQSSLLKLQLY